MRGLLLEKEWGVSHMRGLLYALGLSALAWAAIGYGVSILVNAG